MEPTEPKASESSDREFVAGQEQFRFVSIANPQEAQGRAFQRSVRSHAVKQALQKKRRDEQSTSQNFRAVQVTKERAVQVDAGAASLLPTPFAFRVGPDDVPDHYVKLRALLSSDEAKQAFEPVFSVGDEVAFQTFRSVFRTSLHDPALLNAIMLTATFAMTDGTLDRDCLRYQSETMKTVRQRVGGADEADVNSTLGAMLMLAGIEVRDCSIILRPGLIFATSRCVWE
ncbi:hypothetical protein H2200_006050 [Cladophialophora chaetospira]|uniref:Uncharacterized protein n=1 Tax=Cladophialophora chaetospira TaxID=386627 RepID=A0AA38XA72_9EURO|nr:hypothetical protein H2200_006050 [Cladophialophora chaetospira]